MEYKIEAQARGVRIIAGKEARERRILLNELIEIAEQEGYEEIILPSIEPSKVYIDKAGKEIRNQMYVFLDKKERELCLRPEATATVQLLADKHLKQQKDVKYWYFERCWRYEKPQRGRYREFFQFGIEIINPTSTNITNDLMSIAERMIRLKTNEYEINQSVKRGLDYYIEDGFEISVPKLGTQKQVLGGGIYNQGIGFGLGFDRLMLCD